MVAVLRPVPQRAGCVFYVLAQRTPLYTGHVAQDASHLVTSPAFWGSSLLSWTVALGVPFVCRDRPRRWPGPLHTREPGGAGVEVLPETPVS